MALADGALQQARERVQALERELQRTCEELAEMALLRAGRDELEAGMRERTAELTRSNEELRREVAERERAEATLRRANRALTLLTRANEALIRAREETALLQEICRIIVEVGGYRLTWVGFAEDDAEKSVRPVAQAGFEAGYLERVRVTWADVPRGRGPAGTAVRTGRPMVVRDTRTDPAFAPWREEAIQRGYVAAVGLPLSENGHPFGVLTIYSSTTDPLGDEEVRLLEELANDLSYGIVALRTRAERQRATDELRLDEARLEALLHLNQMADATVREIADYIMEQAVQLTGSTLGYLAFVDEGETVMTMYSWSRQAMRECQIADKPLVYPVDTTGLWGEAIRQRRPIITNDYAAPDPWKKGYPEGHVELRRHMNVPILARERIVAVIGVANKEDEYDAADVRQLRLLGGGMWRILEEKRALDALRESEEKYRSLFAVEPDALVLIDADSGCIVDANDSAYELFGYSGEELLALKATDLSAEPEKTRAVMATWQAGAAVKVPLRRALRKDGTVFPAEVSVRHFQLQGGRLLYAAYRDISARVKADAEVQEAQERLLRTEVEKKRFYREMIRAVTRDKLRLVDAAEIPTEGTAILDASLADRQAYRALRDRLREIAGERGMPPEAAEDLVLAVAEAAANAIKHATGGHCTVYVSEERILARVSDQGSGIHPEDLPATLLLPGYSTTVSLGMGYTLMLEMVDCIWLATGPEGTVVQLAKRLQPLRAQEPPMPEAWGRL